jgi:integrase/recombinase XerD
MLAQTLDEHRVTCMEWLSVRDYSPRTIQTYDLALQEFCRWVETQADLRELSDLTTSALQNYLVFLSLRGSKTTPRGGRKKLLSGATKQGHIAALLQLFHHLVKRGFLLTNPTHELERPRQRHTLPRGILSVKEMFRILAHIDGTRPLELRNRAALELLYTTGMRSGELGKLTLESLRLDESLVLIDGKGSRERLVPVGAETTRALHDYLQLGRPKFQDDSNALFLSRQGGAMKPHSLLRVLRKLLKEARIKKRVDLHSIRHTCATHMLQNGADIRYIQEMLGHASLKTTQIYTRVETADLRKMLRECHPREQF